MKEPHAPNSHRRSLLGLATVALQAVLAVAAVVWIISLAVQYVEAARRRPHPRVSPVMADVDWESPDSSEYCLACHRPVGPAMAGLDVAHGHPQNVPLDERQLRAVEQLGTVTGPGDILICMTCHVLGEKASQPFMLADTLRDGRFCEHCHPGHYARGTPHDLRLTAPDERNRLGQTTKEGGPCSACHLAHRYAREFEPCALDPEGRCITCHSIGGCAAEHARRLMEHPESRCEECHDPHDMTWGEFLRAPASELCLDCHEGLDAGPEHGMHPLGHMDYAVPQALIDAGAWIESDLQELTCVVCHSPHGANGDALLVMPANSNELCLTCHPDMRGGQPSAGVSPHHGEAPRLNPEQQALAAQWGTRIGPDGELLCVTCHRVHGATADMALLAFRPQYGEVCGACHPNHDDVFGTSHDLRTNHPDETNIRGMSVQQYGACSACHLAHGYARETQPVPGDPSGQCATCHREGGCAGQCGFQGVLHPETQCTDCHDPHSRHFGNYLKAAADELCTECHADQGKLAGGPHDFLRHPDRWPDTARESGSRCLACHVAHGGARPDLFRAGRGEPVGMHDDVCLYCHPDAAWGAESDIAAIHPHHISPEQRLVPLALVPTDEKGQLRMGCRTCHDPHGGEHPVHLARVEPGQTTEELCLHCHQEKVYIRYTGHCAASLAELGFDVDSCKPCHATHANPADTWGEMLSPRFLKAQCGELGEDLKPSCVPCLACHHADGPAPVRKVATHPRADMLNLMSPDEPGYLPLFNEQGRIDPRGQVVCRTCHLSHGRLDLLKRLAERGELTHAEMAAVRTQVRPFVTPNLCTECHGAEARARFLFFHDPEKRAFPRSDPERGRRQLPRQQP